MSSDSSKAFNLRRSSRSVTKQLEKQNTVKEDDVEPITKKRTASCNSALQHRESKKAKTTSDAAPRLYETNSKSEGRKTAKQTSELRKVWLSDLMESHSWKFQLNDEFEQEYFKTLQTNLQTEMKKSTVFPPKELMFHAFELTPFNEVKVVILGQDPYHDEGQAHGLSFSVPRGVKVPRSLSNIYKELQRSVEGFTEPSHGCLEMWARQGVLLLNTGLTVRAHEPNSHSKLGWSQFTDAALQVLSSRSPHRLVFILWGGVAHKKKKLLDERHHVICTAHPSPLSFGKFLGCDCFMETNRRLIADGQKPIDWSVHE